MNNEIKTLVGGSAPIVANPSGFGAHLRGLAFTLLIVTFASSAAWAQGLPLRTCSGGTSAYLCAGDIVIADATAGRNSPGGSTGLGALFLVNPSTGVQTLISQGNLLTQTVGVVVEANGNLVAADRLSGIIRVNPATGGQTLLSAAAPSNDFFGIARTADGNFIVTDSGLDFTRSLNVPGRVLKIDATTGAQTVVAQGGNIVHPYGVAIDPLDMSIVVSDMSSFNNQGAIFRIPSGGDNPSVVWGPSGTGGVTQSAPFNCPMGIAVEATRNILATVFSASGYGCASPGIFRVDLTNHVQATVSANPPVGWRVPFGIATEKDNNILVVDEGLNGIYRLNPLGQFLPPTPLSGQDQPATPNFFLSPVGISVPRFQPNANVANVPPTITSLTGPTSPLTLASATATITGNFSDLDLDTHTCTFNWADGTSSTGTVTETNGSGSCSATHTFGSAGVYNVGLTVTDSNGGSATSSFQVVVYDPAAGFMTGGGWIDSPAGAWFANPSLTGKANFGFVSKYQNGASVPSGNTEFQFHAASFEFTSSSYEWLVISGARAQFKGSGTVNGAGSFGFLLTATDGEMPGGGGIDKLRIKIWDKSTGRVVYDNVPGASDDIKSANPQAIGGGHIQIHNENHG